MFLRPPPSAPEVQRLFGDDLFQAAILVLELLQALHLAQLHAAVLGFPPVVRLLADAMRPTEVSDFSSGLAFLDDRQDLLVGVRAPFHRSSSERRTSFYAADRIKGGRSIALRRPGLHSNVLGLLSRDWLHRRGLLPVRGRRGLAAWWPAEGDACLDARHGVELRSLLCCCHGNQLAVRLLDCNRLFCRRYRLPHRRRLVFGSRRRR